MDPNAALAEIRQITSEHRGDFMSDHDADRLCELFDALDEWITRGGFLPTDWERAS